MSHMLSIAQRKAGGSEELKISGWTRIGTGNDFVVRVGVPRALKSGPRKGQLTFRDSKITEVLVSEAELQAEHARYEAATGNCGDCFGNGEVFASWHHIDGTKYRKCSRCHGTGKAPEATP